MYYTDKNVENLYRIFDQNSRKDYLRLDLNENPGGLPLPFIKEVLNKVDVRFISQYPETLEFSEVLANYLGTDISHICLVNGSAEGIRNIIQGFTSPGGKIVGVVPSYFMFQVYSEMFGRNFVGVNYNEDLSINIDNIIKEITPDTQLLILLNPNNPMGNVYSEDEFVKILNKAEKNEVNVLIDEAYHYFYPKTFVKYALNREHIFVTRTFSKLFSLAGCRLGYVVGWPEGIKIVQKLCCPHNTNAFAMLFAEEMIKRPELIKQLENDFHEGREYLIKALNKYNYSHQGEEGNFIFIKPKTNPDVIVERMKKEKKILIKSYAGIGSFGKCLRVSIGAKQYMELFVNALLEIDKED